MPLLLGLDTGGTYTDAVLFEEGHESPVRHSAKALTTHGNLALGIAGAIDAVLAKSGVDPATIALVSLSTTLATNALVEGHGGRTALIFIGFDTADAARGGLQQALAGDPCIHIRGGHTSSGQPAAPLDTEALRQAALSHAQTAEGIAIVSAFASRNTAHEVEARKIVQEATGLPVTCGHELSAKLGGPKRAVTTMLNARLIGLISALIAATETTLSERGVTASLMLVRGDGALVSAAFARQRPIETILSGPAASLVGAATLTGAEDAVVADIGGTTTDIAILHEGRPRLSPEGARIGPHTTMVDAVEMTATGLGGDSRVRLSPGLDAGLTLGPDRALPLSLLAVKHPGILPALQAQANHPLAQELDGQFALASADAGLRSAGLEPAAKTLLSRLGAEPVALATLLQARTDRAHLAKLSARGLIRIAALTPSDAAHILSLQSGWNTQAAKIGAMLMARQKDGRGQPVAESPEALAHRIIAALQEASANAILNVTLRADGLPAAAATDPIIRAGLSHAPRATNISVALAHPLIGLGAAAPTYYPGIAEKLGTAAIIPVEAGVANAIGAVAGRIAIAREILVSAHPEGGFAVHEGESIAIKSDLATAISTACSLAEVEARKAAIVAGAAEPEITTQFSETRATVEGRSVFIEGKARAEATARPRLAEI